MKKKTMTLAEGDKFTLDADYWIEFDGGWDTHDGYIQDAVMCELDRVYIAIADKEIDIEVNQLVRDTIIAQIIDRDDDNHKNKIW